MKVTIAREKRGIKVRRPRRREIKDLAARLRAGDLLLESSAGEAGGERSKGGSSVTRNRVTMRKKPAALNAHAIRNYSATGILYSAPAPPLIVVVNDCIGTPTRV